MPLMEVKQPNIFNIEYVNALNNENARPQVHKSKDSFQNSTKLDLTKLKKNNEFPIETYQEGEENVESSRMNSLIYSSNYELEMISKDIKPTKYRNTMNSLIATDIIKGNISKISSTLEDSNLILSKQSLPTQRENRENTLNASRYAFNKQKSKINMQKNNRSREYFENDNDKYGNSIVDINKKSQLSSNYESLSSTTNAMRMTENMSRNETSSNLHYRMLSNEFTKTSTIMSARINTPPSRLDSSPIIGDYLINSSPQNDASVRLILGSFNNFSQFYNDMKTAEVPNKSEIIKRDAVLTKNQLSQSQILSINNEYYNNNPNFIQIATIATNNNSNNIKNSNNEMNVLPINEKYNSKERYDYIVSNAYSLASTNNNLKLSSINPSGFLEDATLTNNQSQSTTFYNVSSPQIQSALIQGNNLLTQQLRPIQQDQQQLQDNSRLEHYSAINNLTKPFHQQIRPSNTLSNGSKTMKNNNLNYLQGNSEDRFKQGSAPLSLSNSDKYAHGDVSKMKRMKNAYSSDHNSNIVLSKTLSNPFDFKMSPIHTPLSNNTITTKVAEVERINVIISKNLENTNNYYVKNGILQPFKLKINEVKWFYKLLEGTKFTYYIADYIKDINKEITKESNRSNKFDISSNNLSKRIIVVTLDFLIVIRYEIGIIENLKLMQRGLDADRLIITIREDSMLGRESNRGAGITKSNKLSIDNEYFGKSSCSKLSTGNVNLNDEGEILSNRRKKSQKQEEKENIIIKSFFPLKLLLRITSKKFNPNYLSFYFKLSNLELGSLSNEYYKILNLINSAGFEIFNKFTKDPEFLRILKKINDSKEIDVSLSYLLHLIYIYFYVGDSPK